MFWPARTISPACSTVCPMIVANKVLLPTPLRPMTLMHSPRASVRLICSITTVSPYPAETCCNSRASATVGLTQIDRADLRIVFDFARRSFGKKRTTDHDGDTLGEAENEVHVVFDNQYGDMLRQAFH